MSELESHLRRQAEGAADFFWHRLRWRAVAEHLPRDRPFALLDVGAGAGFVGDYLGRDFPRASYGFVEPIDFLERALEERYGAEANARERESYSRYDFVALLDVLEHQEDDRGFLVELLAKMEGGASLIVTVPALKHLWSQWDVALGHHRRYDRPRLRAAFAGLPLQIVELSYLFPELVPPGLLRRRRPPGNAEFPELPRPLNEALYLLGSASVRLRRFWPAGTSLLAVARRD